jgi:hypothetical protein
MLAPLGPSQPFIVRVALDCYADGVPNRAGWTWLSTRFAADPSLDIFLWTSDEQVGDADGEKNQKEERTEQSSK